MIGLDHTKTATMGLVPNPRGLRAPTATTTIWITTVQAMDIILTGLGTRGLLLSPNTATDRASIPLLETSHLTRQ